MTPDTLDALLDAAWLNDRVALRAHLQAYLAQSPAIETERHIKWQDRLEGEFNLPTRRFLGRYHYRGQVAEAFEAQGTRGLVLAELRTAPDAFFRIAEASPTDTFTDYIWAHSDLAMRIENTEATFYQCANGERYLDHAPATLGLKALP